MAITPIDSGATIAALRQEWLVLRDLFTSLSDDEFAAASVLPGWSHSDILAHVVGTESLLAGQAVPERDIGGRSHVRNPIGELNEKWIDQLRSLDRAGLMDAFDTIIEARTLSLAAMSDEELAAETMTPAGPDSYARFMRIRVFDCWIHELDVRDGVGLPAPTSAEPARIAVAEAAVSMPYVLAKRVGVPVGNTVVLRLTGLVEQALAVQVADRAALVSADNVEPTVELTMDTCDFFRLIGGRRDADPSTVSIVGDEALGAQIASNLAYTI